MNYFKTIKNLIKKNARVIRILLILLFLTFILYFFQNNTQAPTVEIGKCQFMVEVAKTATAHYQGLSNRKDLDRDKGMIFLFDSKQDRSFVMRDMFFPLDIIFINDNHVVRLHQNLTPEGSSPSRSYESGIPVDMVLEISGGRSQACDIGVGSKIIWQ